MRAALTIPNAVSVARLGLIPVFLWLLHGRDAPAAAGWLLGFIGATDWVDGYLARRLDQVSEVGKFLDPLADRFAVVAALIGGIIAGVLTTWFAIAILAREGAVAAGALFVAWRARVQVPVRLIGKAATALVYASVAWFFVGVGHDVDALVWLAWALGVPGLVLYYLVAVQYLGDVRRALASGTAD